MYIYIFYVCFSFQCFDKVIKIFTLSVGTCPFKPNLIDYWDCSLLLMHIYFNIYIHYFSGKFYPHCSEIIGKSAFYNHKRLYFHNNIWRKSKSKKENSSVRDSQVLKGKYNLKNL